jgi:hypothetical protein
LPVAANADEAVNAAPNNRVTSQNPSLCVLDFITSSPFK